jgi:hypothetical protein
MNTSINHHYSDVRLPVIFHHRFQKYLFHQIYEHLLAILFYYNACDVLTFAFDDSNLC